MSKIAQYLNEHILGEVTGSEAIRGRFSRDASILTITPELVVFPRVTNDIRKSARFAWQLAEKGHVLPITARGAGTDQTGAAIGKGLIINTTAHLNNIIYLGLKDKERVVHVQPGIYFKALNDTLQSHGLYIPAYPQSAAYSTIGGAVANNAGGQLSGNYGATGEWVNRLEVVLANGDLIETTRISKRELNKKKGLQTFEGEIYRKIDGLIEDNQQLITDKIAAEIRDNTGYHGIAHVKNHDGSFDLTPLFIGSQGTLGIISEIVLKTEYYSQDESVIVAVLASNEQARDAADSLRSLSPTVLDTFDGELFDLALAKGKKYPFLDDEATIGSIGAVVFASFNDFSDGARHRKMKHTTKILTKLNAGIITSEDYSIEELYAIREVTGSVYAADAGEPAYPPLLDGASIAADRREEFALGLGELAKKHHVSLPIHTRYLDGVIYTRPSLDLQKVSDKQKLFKLLGDYAELVVKSGGSMLADSAEGRLKTAAVYAQVDPELLELFTQVRAVFDPYGTLNPGVKQQTDIHHLVQLLRSHYDFADIANNSLAN